MVRPTTRSTLFPYTTLFRSRRPEARGVGQVEGLGAELQVPVAAHVEALGERRVDVAVAGGPGHARAAVAPRSEEHTSELQSQSNIVCRLLLEKKKSP